jgi:hypothetical protein
MSRAATVPVLSSSCCCSNCWSTAVFVTNYQCAVELTIMSRAATVLLLLLL